MKNIISNKAIHDVLYVEDDEGTFFLISELLSCLKTNKIKIEWASTLSSALALMKEKKYELVLLDMGLPDSQGIDTLKSVLNFTREIPVIVMTSLDDFEKSIQTIELGAQDYLIKGEFTGDLLQRAILYAIERNKVEKELENNKKELLFTNKKLMESEIKLKYLNKELSENEKKYRLLAENSIDVIWQMDLECNFIYVNSRILAITEYTQEEWLASNLQSHCSEKDFLKVANYLIVDNCVNSDISLEIHLNTKTGKNFPVEFRCKVICNDKEIPIFIQGSFHDISQRKKTEEELTNALNKARESDRLKSAFLANMSHEIRTPMNGILGFINLLVTPGISDREKEKFLEIINKSGNRLLNTINDLIDISKIEAGIISLNIHKFSLIKLLDELSSFFEPLAKSKNINLILLPEISNGDDPIYSDNEKLHSILSNLIKNSIKFTKEGSITIGYKYNNNFIEFYIEDTGIGIPKNRQEAIFNRFEKADIEDTMVYEGSGLGLAITKAYVEILGGTIEVKSEEGLGSKFTFTILNKENPLDKNTNHKKSDMNNTIVTHKKILNILIAEDDEVSFLYLKSILSEYIENIYHANNGEEAVKICNNTKLDIILMDIKMPIMNGYAAIKEIRTFNKDIFIIAQTAFALIGDKEKALESGANDYISKPINKQELFEKINLKFDLR